MMLMLNGRLLAAADATLSVADRGFTLGDGLFETIKVQAGQPLRLHHHLARLHHGARLLRLELPLDGDSLAADIAQVLAANGLQDAALRLTISRGPAPRGLLPPRPARPTMVLTAGPLPPLLGPARLVVATCTRRNQFSPLAACKTLNALDTILARMEAEECGADDSLMLNTLGNLAETSIANIFVVTADGTIVTPAVAEGALPGVRRADLLRQLGASERAVALDELLNAREAFLTNALSIRAIAAVDGHSIGINQTGPLTQTLLDGMDKDEITGHSGS